MNKIFTHSLYDYIKEYNIHKDEIHSHLQNKSVEHYIEHYEDDDNVSRGIFGWSVGVFMVILLVNLALWIWALVITIKHWPVLPDWAKVICVLGLLPILPFGPVITLVTAYVAKKIR